MAVLRTHPSGEPMTKKNAKKQEKMREMKN
jgi:hypothetical protein